LVPEKYALHLRAMNMLYEGLRTNSTVVIVPSSAIETMELGGLTGLTALTMGLGQDKALGAANNQAQMNHPPEALAVNGSGSHRPDLSGAPACSASAADEPARDQASQPEHSEFGLACLRTSIEIA